jgi:hypothetical protein
MSNTFAVIENGVVTNIIIAETKEIAELVTGETCVQYTEENPARIKLKYENGVFEQPLIPEIIDPLLE